MQERQIMEMKTLGHRQLTDAQLVPEQWPPRQPSS